jgi:predicted Zn-dependent protease
MLRTCILLLLLLTAACGGGEPASPTPDIDPSERELGAEQHPQLLAEFGGPYEGAEAAYLRNLGNKLAGAASLEGQCTFTLVNSDVVNAFAVPGCYIYVTRGLMGIVNSEAELASVLAHELGHIVGDHGERQQKRSFWRGLGVIAVGLITGSDRLTRIAGQAAQYFTLRYSRNQEFESDNLGIRYLRAAGYDPHAAADMLAALGRNEAYANRTRQRDAAKSIPEWARTHPLTENRIERARQKASETGVAPDELPDNERVFLEEVDGLLYGDDPQQGFVLGRRFAHPVMRIAFEAPPGFTLTNSPQAILLEGPDGMRGEFGGGRLPPGGLEAYAEALLDGLLRETRAEVGQPERVRIGSVPAIIVPTIVRTEQGSVQLSIAAYEGPGGAAYHFIMMSPPGELSALRQLFLSFRPLRADEAASLRPRRIQVVAAAASDTVQSMAARVVGESPVELFLMLNARNADQPLKPGELVKIVSLASR